MPMGHYFLDTLAGSLQYKSSLHVHIMIDTSIQVTEYKMIDGELLPFWMEELPEEFKELYKIMKRIKGASAYFCNKALGKTGTFWQKDSFDHFVRTEKEWHNIVKYILDNPVKAGLVEKWEDWDGSYCTDDFSRQVT